ncbi:hypothetical protein MN608_05978 [Microdochium nivale]|nr:hypothetical protein MN608_05978 [Microdochium nivale]
MSNRLATGGARDLPERALLELGQYPLSGEGRHPGYATHACDPKTPLLDSHSGTAGLAVTVWSWEGASSVRSVRHGRWLRVYLAAAGLLWLDWLQPGALGGNPRNQVDNGSSPGNWSSPGGQA